jgi:predicted metal-dependent enzyme (double-stranded beta helix superfamily)
MEKSKKLPIIKNEFSEPIKVKPGYEDFFEGMMTIVKKHEIDNTLGQELQQYALEFLQRCDFSDFQTFSDTLYERVHIGKDEATGWEAIMMCWKKGNQTSIHGHPQFAAYNFATGKFMVEVFKKKNEREAELSTSFNPECGQGFFAIGEAGMFDNHIHRLTCLSDVGYSLHIYSADARLGIKYNVED